MYALGTLLRQRETQTLNANPPNSIPQPTIPAVSAMILDSAPGGGSLSSLIRAFTLALPNGYAVLRILVKVFIFFLYTLGIVRHRVFGVKPVVDRLKEGLSLDDGSKGIKNGGGRGGILPWITSTTPRLYVCSKKDELVPVDEVVQHFEEAKRRGLNVKMDMYDDTPHVAHARRYPERYWGAVENAEHWVH
ncbi:hypothetical protein GYMLUDRAFT_45550 [Collybiopsis luxurians FD-317 M1]|uniref:Uncharacterized protein n=1 Tax=Collybiopsis luxurians FD-317 M1 TaxID=944289 RepID=A0A0D0BRW4_9AGAR|nr:hypothetical protein GYMLUDRAFT_45550 [Collybiopsis luxurians FD-317 M1]